MRVKQTGRSCTAWRDDRCILLALFLLPAVRPEDVEELSSGAFQENAEVSLFPTAFLLSSIYIVTLATHISRKPVSVNLGSVSPKTRELRPYSTSCQEAQSLLLLCRLEAAASDVLQCLQPPFPAAVWDGITLSNWDSVLDGSSPCSPFS